MQTLPSEPTMSSGYSLPLRARTEGSAFDDGPAAPGGHDKPHRAKSESVAGQSRRQLQDFQVQELRNG